jgi:hypothetical protein
MQLNVKKLVDDLGGPAHAAKLAGVVRTAPYGWIKRRYIGSRYLERIKTHRPSLDLDCYFEENASEDAEPSVGVP